MSSDLLEGLPLRSFRLLTALLVSLVLATSCASSTPAPAAAGTATCSYPEKGTAAKAATPPAGVEPNTGTATVTIGLGSGSVTIAMDKSKTPCTIGSFVHLASSGYFDGTTCHRLTTSASLKVLQCGDPSGTGGGGPGYSFADETNASMTYPTGTVAMANSGANTNGSQFFLVYGDSQLNPDYTVFGTITGGLDVLTKIAAAGVSDGSDDGTPASPVTISKVTVS
ncbi:peptidyl-prolyl cis-trans isomerase B (cyclophilin B) [Nakamurella sp. UYEF19]|uniref:peptidylprolyl isomerase n=1 Tax=Nakamurella sp. UYEF19 TaxID=1756392 RepID=UPI0033926AB7